MRTPACVTAVPRRRAFTLIEVMIGVLVLSLGLLGLGAVIPVVVREQRLAADKTLGRSCISDVKTMLLGRPGFDPQDPGRMPAVRLLPAGGPNPAWAGTAVAWDSWIADPGWSGPYDPNPGSNAGTWQALVNGNTTDFDLATGTLTWNDDAYPNHTPPLDKPALTLADRLWPSESAQSVLELAPGLEPNRPQFVWDIVARRVQFGDQYARVINPSGTATVVGYAESVGKPDVIQVAVFVRRIDPAIRLPRSGGTLREVLTQAVAPGDERLPLAVDSSSGELRQNAAPGGSADYAVPVILKARVVANQQDRIQMNSGTQQQKRQAAQAGQKVVDNLGNVYTVTQYDEDDGTGPGTDELIVSPAVPVGAQDRLRQIVFTPQIPAAVELMTITRPVTP